MHRFLASLPPLLRARGAPHQLIISTRYDLALERAFEAAGEEVDVVTYVASGPNRGKFWHKAPGEEPRPIEVPNTYATELALERPLEAEVVSRRDDQLVRHAAGAEQRRQAGQKAVHALGLGRRLEPAM